ncbi:MAG TPA: hypothetical protein VGR77_03985 [Candidatus Dormibacteraeota bacterium]|nr:hypothetical protein [Candidatus Dormibacteraeota bacterium]
MAKVRHSSAETQPVPERVSRPSEAPDHERAISPQRGEAAAFPTGRFDSRGLSAHAILALQRTAGNHAVNGLLQPSSPLPLQRGPSPHPGMTVTPIDPNPGLTVTPIDPNPAAPSKAQPPKVAWMSRQRQTVDGKQLPDVDRMRVGELLIVRVLLNHVEPAALRRMGRMVITSALTEESFAVEDTGVIQINFRATKIGAEHGEMRFAPTSASDEVITASDEVIIPVKTHVEMSQAEFSGKLQEATQSATNAYHAANFYKAQVSRPYREGWKNVKETLKKAAEGDPFNEIVIHLALTFVAGLAGGRVLEAMEHLKEVVLTEGLKELTIHATEAGLHAAMPEASVSLPEDPADWVDAFSGQIEAVALQVGKMLLEMIKANNDNRAGFFRDFDVVAAVHDALTFNGQPMDSLETTAVPEAEDFEKMIWKGWLVGYHGVPDISDADAWLVIMHRLDDIGEDGWEFVMNYLKEGERRKLPNRKFASTTTGTD